MEHRKVSSASVIVPTLNEGRFIGNLLKSLKNQTYGNFEVIIVDGGSRDNTLEIAKKFSARILAKPNTPEFASRNDGGKIAKGNVLLFTSADVIFRKETIQRVLQEFDKDETLGILCGPGQLYEAPLWARIEYTGYYALLEIWTKLTRDFHGSTNFMAVRKGIFKEIGGFQERIDADGYFLNEVASKTKGKFIGDFSVFISGRRAKKMGFVGFNTHFLYALDAFFPFLRETRLVKTLETYSANYRRRQKTAI